MTGVISAVRFWALCWVKIGRSIRRGIQEYRTTATAVVVVFGPAVPPAIGAALLGYDPVRWGYLAWVVYMSVVFWPVWYGLKKVENRGGA